MKWRLDFREPTLMEQWRKVFAVKAIRTGPADTKRKDHEARVVSLSQFAEQRATAPADRSIA